MLTTVSDSDVTSRQWATAWLGVAGVGIVNGGIHRTYIDALGELPAHQVSCLTFVALYAPYVWAIDRRWPFPSTKAAVTVGTTWAIGSAAFDAIVGHYLAGDSWQSLARAYDLSQGRFWSVVMGAIIIGPAAARAARLRSRKSGAPR